MGTLTVESEAAKALATNLGLLLKAYVVFCLSLRKSHSVAQAISNSRFSGFSLQSLRITGLCYRASLEVGTLEDSTSMCPGS